MSDPSSFESFYSGFFKRFHRRDTNRSKEDMIKCLRRRSLGLSLAGPIIAISFLLPAADLNSNAVKTFILAVIVICGAWVYVLRNVYSICPKCQEFYFVEERTGALRITIDIWRTMFRRCQECRNCEFSVREGAT